MPPVTFSALYLPLLLSGLAILICVISFFFIKSYIKRRTSREWILQEGILTEIRDEVGALLKSIDETTDRDITLVKEREENLRSLLGEVEKRLRVYIREMEKRTLQEETFKTLSDSGSQTFPVSPQRATAERATSERSSPERSTPAAIDGTYVDLGKLRYSLKRQEAAADSVQAPEPKADQDPANFPSISDQIYPMLKAGFSAPLIASRLGLSITEVEFVTELLERRESDT